MMNNLPTSIKQISIALLPAIASASMVMMWYETHPTRSELKEISAAASSYPFSDAPVYKINLEAGIVVIPEMLDTTSTKQTERPKDLVQSWISACPRKLRRSVKKGDFVYYKDFGL